MLYPGPMDDPHGDATPPPGLASRAARLALLVALVVARPVYALAGGHPEYFAAYHCDGLDVVLVALGLWLVPTFALVALEALVGALVGARVHRSVLGLLVAVLVIELVGEWAQLGPEIGLLPALLLAWIFSRSLAPRRHRPLAVAGLWLIAAAVPAHFLLATRVAVLLRGEHVLPAPPPVRKKTSVVLVVFDALPLYAMLDAAGELDAARYPAFARLAATSTWFRQATAAHTYTVSAIPAILTGRYPVSSHVPIARNFPENLFRLVGGDLDLRVYEAGTRLLSLDAKSALRFRRGRLERLGSIVEDALQVVPVVMRGVRAGPELATAAQRFGLFEGTEGLFGKRPSRDEYFTDFIDHVSADDPASLYYLHSILPHAPWRLLPGGDRYPPYHVNGVTMELGELPNGQPIQRYRWLDDPWLVHQCYQRILLQAMYCDRLLGLLLDKLEATGKLDESLVIVTADHGTYLHPDRYLRELFTEQSPEFLAGEQPATQAELLAVPLLVKRPGQTEPATSDRNVEHIDLVPTIADVLEVDLPWQVDGVSIFQEGAARAHKAPRDTNYRIHELPPVIEGVATAGASKRAWFAASKGDDASWVYQLAPHADLVGRAVDTLPVSSVEGPRVTHEPPRPEHVLGWVDGGGPPRFLVITSGGVVCAITRTGPPQEGRRPWIAFHPPGTVDASIEVFLLEERPGAPPRLLRTPGA